MTSRSRRAVLQAGLGSAVLASQAQAATPVPEAAGAVEVSLFGAIGDGVTDDSPAIAAACRFAMHQFKLGRRCYLKFGSGRFLLGGTPTPLFAGAPIGVRGEGPHQTVLVIDRAHQGDVFSWSNCWDRAAYQRNTRSPEFTAGAFVEDIGFVGTRDRETPYNALGFYDINDNVRVNNVEFDYILGSAICSGRTTRPGGFGILRESRFSELRIFHSGTAELPCIEVASSGTSDGTNEIVFSQVDIFAPGGHGFVIRNFGTQPVRLIKIFGLRIEFFLSGFNGLQVGDAVAAGKVYGINAMGLELIAGVAGSVALAVLGAEEEQVEACFFQGQIVHCGGDGILVTTGYGNRIDMLMNAAARTTLILRRTRHPLYYSCPVIKTVEVENECRLLLPSYTPYLHL